MNELAKLLREASEGRWITTRAGNRIFIGDSEDKIIANKVFNTQFTDMPYYDNLLKNPDYYRENKGVEGKILYITSDEYIEKSAELHNAYPEIELTMINDKNVDRIIKYSKSHKLPMPVLNFADHEQEGRHRAIAAQRMGIKKIPVLVVTKVGNPNPSPFSTAD